MALDFKFSCPSGDAQRVAQQLRRLRQLGKISMSEFNVNEMTRLCREATTNTGRPVNVAFESHSGEFVLFADGKFTRWGTSDLLRSALQGLCVPRYVDVRLPRATAVEYLSNPKLPAVLLDAVRESLKPE
jgi:hypothetical protein